MSKSKRNTVDPDDIISTYGADTARWFMLSDSPPERDVIWSEEGVRGAARFVQRLWRLINEIADLLPYDGVGSTDLGPVAFRIRKTVHRALARYEDDVNRLRFNVCVANIYDLVNKLEEEHRSSWGADDREPDPDILWALREGTVILVQLFAPMMPHLAEECWQVLGQSGLVSEASWPKIERDLLVEDTVMLVVQVNGKKRGEVTVARGAQNPEIEAAVLALDAVKQALAGKSVRKVIIIPMRIVNVVG